MISVLCVNNNDEFFQLGDDVFGKEYLNHLVNNGVETSHVSLIEKESCGVAQISVADNGK